MAHFDEKSGCVPCKTKWGMWWQTVDDVTIEISVDDGTSARDIKCDIKPKHLYVAVRGVTVVEGDFSETVHADDAIWTLEDRKLLRINVQKSVPGADHCWPSLLVGQYAADPLVYDQMQQKLTLQRYQLENPGMDFSGAEITGNYHEGGPQLPS